MSVLVLQSYCLGRESWWLCLVCLPGVSWFLAVPWVCPQFVIVVFPDHTHLLFFIIVLSKIDENHCKQIVASLP